MYLSSDKSSRFVSAISVLKAAYRLLSQLHYSRSQTVLDAKLGTRYVLIAFQVICTRYITHAQSLSLCISISAQVVLIHIWMRM